MSKLVAVLSILLIFVRLFIHLIVGVAGHSSGTESEILLTCSFLFVLAFTLILDGLKSVKDKVIKGLSIFMLSISLLICTYGFFQLLSDWNDDGFGIMILIISSILVVLFLSLKEKLAELKQLNK